MSWLVLLALLGGAGAAGLLIYLWQSAKHDRDMWHAQALKLAGDLSDLHAQAKDDNARNQAVTNVLNIEAARAEQRLADQARASGDAAGYLRGVLQDATAQDTTTAPVSADAPADTTADSPGRDRH